MLTLDQLTYGTRLQGLIPHQTVTLIHAQPYSPEAITITYRTEQGTVAEALLLPEQMAKLRLASARERWQFDGDGANLRLASEALRLRLGYLFDPYLAVHTSLVEPLPHQITAVYEKLLPRQPLKYLLADDPGAGKTIMAGLLIKELMMRGDVHRCLIVCPGSLAEQWQDELHHRFSLDFTLFGNDHLQAHANPFHKQPLLIARLDKLARDETVQALLRQAEWDLVVVDEAHKMSASIFGGEVSYTKRFRLGQQLSGTTRHLLLMTATPHNGKEAEFRLFMSLLDPDRFEGAQRSIDEEIDVSDLMRRMVKEQLLTFENKRLFPERFAYTVPYALSNMEQELYEQVTSYVQQQFNRAMQLEDGSRRGAIGFALTILQRRLASSPAAIHASLQRRRERQEKLLQENALLLSETPAWASNVGDDPDDWEEELLPAEYELQSDELSSQATAALNLDELRQEIETLRQLEQLAHKVRLSGRDRKWEELRDLLLQSERMYDEHGARRKLVIFTEHKDTLLYLQERIGNLLGQPEAVLVIHGGLRRPERLAAQHRFTQDPTTAVLLATDAAGEGINLQRAHLMVNYDLPWNPNRLEQRFGRIHRIGQQNVCHLWNLIAANTREGAVYQTLLKKLEKERQTLGEAVFDVLGKVITGKQLRELLIEAIRYGDDPAVQAQLHQKVEGALPHDHLVTLLQEKALAHEVLPTDYVTNLRHEMARMEARKLQPLFVEAFFTEAIAQFGGKLHRREEGRWELTRLPQPLRPHASHGTLSPRYERLCFDKQYIRHPGGTSAELICPGHPLLETLLAEIQTSYGGLLAQGAILVDETDLGEEPRLLLYLQQEVRDGRGQTISHRLQFVEQTLPHGTPQSAGFAPYKNYRPLLPSEEPFVAPFLAQLPPTHDLIHTAEQFAITHLAPNHLQEVQAIRLPLLEKTELAVRQRLLREIAYWDRRANELLDQERAGKPNSQLNSERARQRAEELEQRLNKRTAELALEQQLIPHPPRVIGAAIIWPLGWLARQQGQRLASPWESAAERRRVERAAMRAVIADQERQGHTVRDVSKENEGYDLLVTTATGEFRFIEVKGCTSTHFFLTNNEVCASLNKGKAWWLALVRVPPQPHYPDGVLQEPPPSTAYGVGLPIRYRQPPLNPFSFGQATASFTLADFWVD
jgi:SNF2 family DNA or RNA helicase